MVNFNATVLASKYEEEVFIINQNDYFENIYIYNAKSQGMDSNYTVTVTETDGTSKQVD